MNPLLITPIATEKAYGLVSKDNYVFKVPVKSNKVEIKSAIESQYGVSVVSVRTSLLSGKAIRYTKARRAQPGVTTRQDIKKAYVTLKKGDSIKVFDEPAEQKEEKK